jgi:hypothetical protein
MCRHNIANPTFINITSSTNDDDVLTIDDQTALSTRMTNLEARVESLETIVRSIDASLKKFIQNQSTDNK